MKIYGAVLAAGLIAAAVAGCSSSSGTPSSAGAVASSIKAQATSAAAPSSAAGGSAAAGGSSAAGGVGDRSKDCPDAIAAAKAALSGMSVTEVSLPEGCTVVYIKTPSTDKQVGKDMCDKVAGEVFQLGILGIAVESDGGDSLALGAPSQPCMTL
jgi:hypothetical protein